MGECFFWYRPSWVVPDKRPLNRPTRVVPYKRPLNGCVCVCDNNQIRNRIRGSPARVREFITQFNEWPASAHHMPPPASGWHLKHKSMARATYSLLNLLIEEAVDHYSCHHPHIGHHCSNKAKTSNAITIRYDTRCYFNVRSKADMCPLNLTHGT